MSCEAWDNQSAYGGMSVGNRAIERSSISSLEIYKPRLEIYKPRFEIYKPTVGLEFCTSVVSFFVGAELFFCRIACKSSSDSHFSWLLVVFYLYLK